MRKAQKQLTLFELEPKKRKARKKRGKSIILAQGKIVGVEPDYCSEALDEMEKELAAQGISMEPTDEEELLNIAMDDIQSNGGQMTTRAIKIFEFLEIV